MNTVAIVLTGLTISSGFGTLAWHTAKSRSSAESQHQLLSARAVTLAAQLRDREVELAALQKGVEECADSAQSETPKTAPEPGAASSSPKAANTFIEWLQDPAVQVLYLAKQRAELPQTYGPFFRSAKLTPELIDRLCDVIIESRAHTHDLSEINRLKGVSLYDPAMVAERDRAKAERRQMLIELLGEGGYAKFEDYTRALEVRTYIGRVAGSAAVEGVPLTWQQADALALILANTCPEYAAGGRAELSRVDWKAAEAQAARILPPVQMKFLRVDSPNAISTRRHSELSTAAHRALQETGGTGAPPPHTAPRMKSGTRK